MILFMIITTIVIHNFYFLQTCNITFSSIKGILAFPDGVLLCIYIPIYIVYILILLFLTHTFWDCLLVKCQSAVTGKMPKSMLVWCHYRLGARVLIPVKCQSARVLILVRCKSAITGKVPVLLLVGGTRMPLLVTCHSVITGKMPRVPSTCI